MDAWAALWFWPLTDTGGAVPPTLDQWIEACQALLGREPEARKKNRGMTPLGEASNWDDLNDAEELNLDFAGAVNVEQVLKSHPWLKVCETVAEQQGFFHWELDFATVFARGGFDLQLGNPPWVRPRHGRGCAAGRGRPVVAVGSQTKRGSPQGQAGRDAGASGNPRPRRRARQRTSVVTAEYLGSAQAYPLWPDCSRISTDASWNRHGSMRHASGIVDANPPRVTFH